MKTESTKKRKCQASVGFEVGVGVIRCGKVFDAKVTGYEGDDNAQDTEEDNDTEPKLIYAKVCPECVERFMKEDN